MPVDEGQRERPLASISAPTTYQRRPIAKMNKGQNRRAAVPSRTARAGVDIFLVALGFLLAFIGVMNWSHRGHHEVVSLAVLYDVASNSDGK